MGIVLKPKVYLVGRPSLVKKGIKEFFEDEDVYFQIKNRDITEKVSCDFKFCSDDDIFRVHVRDKKWSINTNNEAEILCMTAGKICYDAYGKGNNDIEPYIEHIVESGHHSVLEHAQWSFIIKGSRIWSHEHVRHRIGVAISQRSQRYVKESDANFMMRPEIYERPELRQSFQKHIEEDQKLYDKFVEAISNDIKSVIPDSTLRIKTARSSARALLPNAAETYIFWSANARALRHYIDLRANKNADWEIREVAIQVLKMMQVEAPNIFADYEIKMMLPERIEVAVTKLDRYLARVNAELEEQFRVRSDEPETQKKIWGVLTAIRENKE